MYKQNMCVIEISCKDVCFRCKIVLNKCMFHYDVDFAYKMECFNELPKSLSTFYNCEMKQNYNSKCIVSFLGHPISWALLNPSVSPFKISANGLVVESSNPAVRLYRYNTFTGEVC